MHSRDLNQCTPGLKNKWVLFKEAAEKIGISVLITCTSRSEQEQAMIYAQGRMSVENVNYLRAENGYPPISTTQNKKVTWTMDSKHVVGSKRELSGAIDYVIIKHSAVVWDIKADVNEDGAADYLQLAKIAESVGLKPGAYFKTPDYCHLEE